MGPSLFSFAGVRLERGTQEVLAVKAGCKTLPRITKAVELVVLGHQSGATPKLDKARDYGIEMASESAFWSGLGLRLEAW